MRRMAEWVIKKIISAAAGSLGIKRAGWGGAGKYRTPTQWEANIKLNIPSVYLLIFCHFKKQK